MTASNFPNLISFLGSIGLVFLLILYAWRQRLNSGSVPLILLLILSEIWLIFRTFELVAIRPEEKLDWFILAIACNPLMYAAGFSIVFEYVNHGKWFNRQNILFLVLPSCLLSMGILAQDPDHTIWSKVWLGGVLNTFSSPIAWTFILLYLFYFVISTFLLIRTSLRWPLYRWSSTLILLGLYTLGVIDLLKVAGIISTYPIDLSVLVHDFALLMLVLGVLWLRSIEVVTMARNTAIENMQDGILVIDLQDRLTFHNPAARNILNLPWVNFDDRNVVLNKKMVDKVASLNEKSSGQPFEIMVQNGEKLEYYIMYSTSLNGPHNTQLGRLFIFQNVTEMERAQKELLKQQYTLAVVEERERLARELHDDLGQVLGYAKMQAQAAYDFMDTGDQDSAKQTLARLVSVVQNAHQDVRKYIYNNHQAVPFNQEDFIPALQRFLEHYAKMFSFCVNLDVPKDCRSLVLDPNVQLQLLRIIQEALNNAQKHSQANCVSVCFARMDNYLQVTVQDDGKGFDPNNLSIERGNSFGLGFMLQRAEKIGGNLKIDSVPDQGTRIDIQVPLQSNTVQPVSLHEEFK